MSAKDTPAPPASESLAIAGEPPARVLIMQIVRYFLRLGTMGFGGLTPHSRAELTRSGLSPAISDAPSVSRERARSTSPAALRLHGRSDKVLLLPCPAEDGGGGAALFLAP